MPQRQLPQSSNPDAGFAIAELIKGLIRGICLTIEVFVRWDLGSRYVCSGFAGVIVIWLFSLHFAPAEVGPLLDFSVVYCVFWLVSLIRMLIRYFGGKDKLHSKYTGRPHLMRLLPRWREEYVKLLDATIAILLGFGVRQLNVPLGDYLIGAASLLIFRDYAIYSGERNQAVDMNDQVIERKIIAEKFRAMQE